MNKALLASLVVFGLAFVGAAPVLAQGAPPNFPARSDVSSSANYGSSGAQAQEQNGESEAAK